MTKLTFNDLVALEPRLAHLLTEARSHKPSRKFCANEAWYGYFGFSGLKGKLLRLVGWGRETPPDGATDAAKEETPPLCSPAPKCALELTDTRRRVTKRR